MTVLGLHSGRRLELAVSNYLEPSLGTRTVALNAPHSGSIRAVEFVTKVDNILFIQVHFNCPSVGLCRPSNALIKVLLPEPEGPQWHELYRVRIDVRVVKDRDVRAS